MHTKRHQVLSLERIVSRTYSLHTLFVQLVGLFCHSQFMLRAESDTIIQLSSKENVNPQSYSSTCPKVLSDLPIPKNGNPPSLIIIIIYVELLINHLLSFYFLSCV